MTEYLGNQLIAGASSVLMSFPPGCIVSYGGEIPPEGWLKCDGGAISRTIYKDLFSVIGTAYGAGDGNTTFNLPNISELKLMTTNIIPSLGVKGNGKNLGLSNGSSHFGLSRNTDGAGDKRQTLNFSTSINVNIGSNAPTYSVENNNNIAYGIITDASKSGIITNTGTMSAVSSRAIIKY